MIDFKRLSDKFPADDVEWRIGQSGLTRDGKVWASALAYLTARAVQQRLDDVCGPSGWRNEYQPGPQGGVLCGLALRVGDEWIAKWDGAENTDIESVKGGLSDAMKRAAVQWGIGRYLYQLPNAWAVIQPDDARDGFKGCVKGKNGAPDVWYRWRPPTLPDWALPAASTNGHPHVNGNGQHKPQSATQPPAGLEWQRFEQWYKGKAGLHVGPGQRWADWSVLVGEMARVCDMGVAEFRESNYDALNGAATWLAGELRTLEGRRHARL